MSTIILNPNPEDKKISKIIIEAEILQKIVQEESKKNITASGYAILTDEKIKKLYGETLKESLQSVGYKADIFLIPSGEKNKNIQNIEKCAIEMVEKGYDRLSVIMAIGGGIIGDVAGFLASIYMRGIRFINIPTTLLSMVDASIGGKTGVDLKIGKNLLGTFYKPETVYIDPLLLASLNEQEFKNGLCELIKHAIIRDKNLFEFIEKNTKKIIQRDSKILNKIIVRSCRIKTEIVKKDTKESHLRMILNYGHTLGHALEQASKYKIPHGLCVAKGIIAINEITVRKKLLKKEESKRIYELFEKFCIDTSWPKKISIKNIMDAMLKDKKFQNGKKNFVIIKNIGNAKVTNSIDIKDITQYLRRC